MITKKLRLITSIRVFSFWGKIAARLENKSWRHCFLKKCKPVTVQTPQHENVDSTYQTAKFLGHSPFPIMPPENNFGCYPKKLGYL